MWYKINMEVIFMFECVVQFDRMLNVWLFFQLTVYRRLLSVPISSFAERDGEKSPNRFSVPKTQGMFLVFLSRCIALVRQITIITSD